MVSWFPGAVKYINDSSETVLLYVNLIPFKAPVLKGLVL